MGQLSRHFGKRVDNARFFFCQKFGGYLEDAVIHCLLKRLMFLILLTLSCAALRMGFIAFGSVDDGRVRCGFILRRATNKVMGAVIEIKINTSLTKNLICTYRWTLSASVHRGFALGGVMWLDPDILSCRIIRLTRRGRLSLSCVTLSFLKMYNCAYHPAVLCDE